MSRVGTGSGQPRRGRIAHHSVEQVLDRADLGDLVAGYTQLRPQGGELQGRCPFHDERSPSFWVNPAKRVYHCFGCGASGDTITFVQEKLGLDFVESIEYLADRYRVQLEFEDGGAGSQPRVSKRRLYELMEAATGFFERHLWSSGGASYARSYLAERHISEATARAFRMGYSPTGESVLASGARQRGFTDSELQDARLIVASGRDFFRGRLMVPIIDRADRVIGFGARKLREEQFGGKYVNSADGPLFHKKQVIFRSPGLRAAAIEAGQLVVVEGYMDVIALWQAGFRNCCAVMGTALTEQQVTELKRLAPQVLFAFDPDAAGQAATLRALEQAERSELEVRVVLLPDGDPADVVSGAEGRDQMSELLDGSVSLLHYRVSSLLGSEDLSTDVGRERVWKQSLQLFGSVPDSPERKQQVDRLAFGLGLDSASVQMLQRATGADRQLAELRSGTRGHRDADRRDGGRAIVNSGSARPSVSAEVMLERRFLAAALYVREHGNMNLAEATSVEEDFFTLDLHRRAWADLVTSDKPLDISRIRSDTELVGLTAELTALGQRERLDATGDNADAVIRELESRLERRWLDRAIAALKEQITNADDVLELLAAKASLEQRRQAVIARLRASPHEE
jgi:DNA primase